MQGRRSPPKGLEFFPTPPWATRAFLRHVLRPACTPLDLRGLRALDPCCGEGHMVDPLAEFFGPTFGSDVFDYGCGFAVEDALAPRRFHEARVDFVATNPPFGKALEIVQSAIAAMEAGCLLGVAVLVRSAWLEGQERYAELFNPAPPSIVAPYVERVPMVEGRYDPKASTATSYSWVTWLSGWRQARPEIWFIPPSRREMETAADIRRWCAPADAPLLDGASA